MLQKSFNLNFVHPRVIHNPLYIKVLLSSQFSKLLFTTLVWAGLSKIFLLRMQVFIFSVSETQQSAEYFTLLAESYGLGKR